MDRMAGVRKRLAAIAKKVAVRETRTIAEWKRQHRQLRRPDFLWHILLQSFATMGRVTAWHGLIGNRKNYSRVRYENLARLPVKARTRQVVETCRAAKVRMPELKAKYILRCFEQIKDLGGPRAATRTLLGQAGRDGKIGFLKAFYGIGEKYARNIMMDVYHAEFRNSIAIDARIKSLSKAWGLSFSSYESHENFYLAVAARAGLNGWELDRLMFHFKRDFMPSQGTQSDSNWSRRRKVTERAAAQP